MNILSMLMALQFMRNLNSKLQTAPSYANYTV